MSDFENGNSFLSGIMIGGILGAALVLVLSGDETRTKLQKKLEEFDFEKAIDKFSKAFEEGTKEAKETTKKIVAEEEL